MPHPLSRRGIKIFGGTTRRAPTQLPADGYLREAFVADKPSRRSIVGAGHGMVGVSSSFPFTLSQIVFPHFPKEPSGESGPCKPEVVPRLIPPYLSLIRLLHRTLAHNSVFHHEGHTQRWPMHVLYSLVCSLHPVGNALANVIDYQTLGERLI